MTIFTSLAALGALLCSVSLFAQEEPSPAPTLTLAQLAEAADLVAVVRVLDTDYQYTREFPSGGSAFLEVLIPYKVSRPLEDILEVYEEGLHAGECYFDNPSVLEEGRRHLVFLTFSEEVSGQYNGLAQGCKLEVLVTTENRYALRYPLNGLPVADDLTALVRELEFQDGYAVLDEEEITPPERNQLLADGHLERAGDLRYRYTRGVPLEEVRKLMGPAGLTLDRSLR
ncbi:MAG: hypothetical protein HKN58_10525 [Xanthomonadales bacterium]|nr:hypothetical protein [Xanthomonadales bacterium]